MRIKPAIWLTAALFPALVSAQNTSVRLVGRVISNESGEAISGAVVRVGDAQVTTDQRGLFLITLPGPLAVVMSVEMIGYTTRTDSLKPAAGTSDVTIRLSRNPVKLPPVTVTVRSSWLEQNGFYERRMEGGKSGHYIDRVEIEKRNPTFMTDLFHGVAGTKVHNLGMSMRVIQFSRPDGSGLRPRNPQEERLKKLESLAGCQPWVYIDGRPHGDILENGRNYVLDFNMLSPDAIEAIEVYVGAAAPVQFRNENGCGVLLIWTRRGR